jgi:GWxTD domain-containing protein
MQKLKIYFLSLMLLLSSSALLNSMDLSVTTAAFRNDQGSYIELYLYVVGSSVHFDSLENGDLQGGIELIIKFYSGEDIVNFDKFTLYSPQSSKLEDFVGIKRFALPQGSYELIIEAVDIYDPSNTFNHNAHIEIDLDPIKIQLSDIQLLSAFEKTALQNDFVKNGYFLESNAFNYFPPQYDYISFYLEIYNPTADQQLATYIRYAIYRELANGNTELVSQRFKKLDAKSIQAQILQLPLMNITSGNYKLIVELRNKDKMHVDEASVSFQRNNPEMDLKIQLSDDDRFESSFATKLNAEEVRYALKAITPLTKGMESTLLDQLFFSDDLKPKQYFLYTYFSQLNPADPAKMYNEFMKIAAAVDNTYRSNVGYGFETDRGKIFMKYGKPTEIVHMEDEPSAPPYEIWFYNKLDDSKQYNVKFLFYNPSLATNDFILLHSNCRGERYNPRWEVELYDNAPNEQAGQNAASTEMQDNYRRNARRIWEEL